jgi:hypothetical protein
MVGIEKAEETLSSEYSHVHMIHVCNLYVRSSNLNSCTLLHYIHNKHRHTEYTDEQDGTKRCRVRFNLEGQFGKAFVFAEQSSDMPAGEMVYGTLSFHVRIPCCVLVDNLSNMFYSPSKSSCKTSKMDGCLLWWIIELQLQPDVLLEEINREPALCKIC